MVDISKLNENYLSISELSQLTKESPLVIHTNPSGLIRLGNNNNERLERFNTIINKIEEMNGNIIIPSFSYSFLGQKEVFDIKHTPSKIDYASEFVRTKNPNKRTSDPNFSYLIFGKALDLTAKYTKNINTFGKKGLIHDLFINNAYLCAVGGALEHLTELHYIEKKLKVEYRCDKKFSGIIRDYYGKESFEEVTYFCRDLNSEYIASFLKFKEDIRKSNIYKKIFLKDYKLRLEVVRFKDCYYFLKDKLNLYPKYCWGKK